MIGRAKFEAILTRTNTSREQALAQVRQLAEVIDPQPLTRRVCRDPDDDAVLALALVGRSRVGTWVKFAIAPTCTQSMHTKVYSDDDMLYSFNKYKQGNRHAPSCRR